MILEVKDVIRDFIGVDIQELYQPIILNDIVLFEATRKHMTQLKYRISLFPSFKDESVVDIGCNVGYILQQLKKHKSAAKCYGLDNNKICHAISSKITEMEQTNIEFKLGDIMEFIPSEKFKVDNALFLSVTSPLENHYNLTFDKVLDKIQVFTRKAIFVEPTNHRGDSIEYMRNYYDEYLTKWGEPEFLGITDYEDRVLYRIKQKY